jgi:hypothetical protein
MIKPRHVYQYLESTQQAPSREPRIVPTGVFVEVLDLGDNGFARCRVIHVTKHVKGLRIRKGQKVFFSIVNLGQPDLFPKLSHKPIKWLQSVINPEPWAQVAHKAVEANYVTAAAMTAEEITKFIRKDQIFKSHKAQTIRLLSVTSQNNIEYKTTDKEYLKHRDDFVKYLIANEYWTSERLNWKKHSRIVWTLLTPFVGMLGSVAILKIFEKRILAS